jgi:AcrR family transcriptional regulator
MQVHSPALHAADSDLSELTVRGICKQAGFALRYFYESFTDKDDLVAAVFDWVIADIAATTQAAVAAAPLKEQSRAGMANIVRTIAADTRVGRLLFSSQLSNPVVVRKRAESGALMAMLLLQHAGSLGAQTNDFIKATSHFAVGGVGQTITAWLEGDFTLDTDQLVDQLAAIIDQLAAPELYKS